jgi:hypothetical protein
MRIRILNGLPYLESVLKRDIVFTENIKKQSAASFAAMAHLAEGVCLEALLTLKVENSIPFFILTC